LFNKVKTKQQLLRIFVLACITYKQFSVFKWWKSVKSKDDQLRE